MPTPDHTPTTLYSWRIFDQVSPWRKTKPWRTLSWKMTEMDAVEWAAKEGFEIEKVKGSGQIVSGLGSTSEFLNGKS